MVTAQLWKRSHPTWNLPPHPRCPWDPGCRCHPNGRCRCGCLGPCWITVITGMQQNEQWNCNSKREANANLIYITWYLNWGNLYIFLTSPFVLQKTPNEYFLGGLSRKSFTSMGLITTIQRLRFVTGYRYPASSTSWCGSTWAHWEVEGGDDRMGPKFNGWKPMNGWGFQVWNLQNLEKFWCDFQVNQVKRLGG